MAELDVDALGEFLGKFEGHEHRLRRVVFRQDVLMVCVAACACTHHALHDVQVAPFRHVGLTVSVAFIVVDLFFLGLLLQFDADFAEALEDEFRHLLQFADGEVAGFPVAEEFLLHVGTDFACDLGDDAFLRGIVVRYARFAEEVDEALVHDAVELVERAAGLLGVFSPRHGLVVPIVVECVVFRVVGQHLLFEGEMGEVEHPLLKVFLVEVFGAEVAVALLVGVALVLTPVVELELVEHAFAHGVGDMLEHAEFGIHHALDAEGIHLFRAGHADGTCLRVGIGRLVVFIGEVVHVLEIEGADEVLVGLVVLLDEEHAGKHVVAHNLGQFGQRVDGHSVFVDVAIERHTVGHTFHAVVEIVCFAVACHVLGEPCASLQGIELVDGGIAVLIVAALVHVGLRQVLLGKHGEDVDDGLGEGLARLHNHIDHGAGARTAVQTGEDVDVGLAGIARNGGAA